MQLSKEEFMELFEPQLSNTKPFTKEQVEDICKTRRAAGRSESQIKSFTESIIIGESKQLYFMIEPSYLTEHSITEIQKCLSNKLDELFISLRDATFVHANNKFLPKFSFASI